MVSKMVIDRQKAAAALGAALDTHAEEASALFAQLLEPHVDDDGPVPDLSRLQRLLQRRLQVLATSLVSADEVHVTEKQEDQAVRKERDLAVAALRPSLARIRSILEAACGAGTCSTLFAVAGPSPRDPVILQRVVRRMVDRMSAETFALPKVVDGGLSIDTAAWVAELEPPLLRLEATLGQLLKEGRESVNTRFAKSGVMAEYDRAYLSTARILEELFRYIGMTEKADTMRPTKRSGSSPEEPSDSSAAAPGTAGASPELPDLFPDPPAPPGPDLPEESPSGAVTPTA